jgi:hypothetical protein
LIAYFSIPIFSNLQKGKYSEKLKDNISSIFKTLLFNKFTIFKIFVYLIQSIIVFYFFTNFFPKTNICTSLTRDYYDIEDYFNKNKIITEISIKNRGNLNKKKYINKIK